MASPQTYQYTPLEEKLDKHIRLLTLYPLLSSNTINCTLTTYELAAAPLFDALSYTWGSEGGVKPINIDGCRLLIRRNLWDFLRYLCATQAPKDGKLLVWADAVCIDQHNVGERNHQVGLMGDIYSYAKSVIAWIRVAHSPKGKLEAGLTYKRLLSTWCSKERQHQARSVGGSSIQNMLVLSKKFRSEWILFRKLCEAEYWSRTWIIQEILLAKKIQMIVEKEEISWDVFTYPLRLSENVNSGARILMNVERLTNSTLNGLETLESLPMLMASQRARTSSMQQHNKRFEKLDRLQPRSTPLLELLRAFEGSKCVAIHDKVYALLSLCSDCRDFPVDYTTSRAQLCRDLYFHVRPTQDIEGFITTVAGTLHVKSQESSFSFRHKVALAVGYYPQCCDPTEDVRNRGCASFRGKGIILGILPKETWYSTRKRLQEAACQSHVADGMFIEMVRDCQEAALPEGYFDPIFAQLVIPEISVSLNNRVFEMSYTSAAVLCSKVKFGDSRIALVKIDGYLLLARVCPAAAAGNILYLVEGSRAALIVQYDYTGETLIGMAALPVRGRIDPSSNILDDVAFQDGCCPPRYWSSAFAENASRDFDISYREEDVLCRAQIDALQTLEAAHPV